MATLIRSLRPSTILVSLTHFEGFKEGTQLQFRCTCRMNTNNRNKCIRINNNYLTTPVSKCVSRAVSYSSGGALSYAHESSDVLQARTCVDNVYADKLSKFSRHKVYAWFRKLEYGGHGGGHSPAAHSRCADDRCISPSAPWNSPSPPPSGLEWTRPCRRDRGRDPRFSFRGLNLKVR